ncbi:MAG: hypothetical protein KA419_13670 [Acidobacteria bacterium]|nr:hypothetical protein [Acidobacteriota bacterium]
MGIEQRAVTGLLPRVGSGALTVSPAKGLPRPSDPPLRPAVTGAPETPGVPRAGAATATVPTGPAPASPGVVRSGPAPTGVKGTSRGEGGAR